MYYVFTVLQKRTLLQNVKYFNRNNCCSVTMRRIYTARRAFSQTVLLTLADVLHGYVNIVSGGVGEA